MIEKVKASFALARVKKRKKNFVKTCEIMKIGKYSFFCRLWLSWVSSSSMPSTLAWRWFDQLSNLALSCLVLSYLTLPFLSQLLKFIQPCFILFHLILSYSVFIKYLSTPEILYWLFLQGGRGAPTESCSWEYHRHDDIIRWWQWWWWPRQVGMVAMTMMT